MKIALMFSGQGAQYVGMGKSLYDTYECARNIFDQADQILGYSLSTIMFENEEKLHETEYTQVAMFTLYAAALEILKVKGVEAYTSMGLSLGEYGAMYHNQVFDFETGLKLLQHRGRYMQEASKNVEGKMSAILGMDAEALTKLMEQVQGFVAIANYNTYGQLVISGEEQAVLEVNQLALEHGAKRAILLQTSGPFHTSLMNEAREKLGEYIEPLTFQKPAYQLLVNTTGTFFDGDIKEEMTSQVTNSVKFYQMVEECLNEGVDTFIEIGPKKTLLGFVKKVNRNVTMCNIEDIDSLEATLKKLEVSQ